MHQRQGNGKTVVLREIPCLPEAGNLHAFCALRDLGLALSDLGKNPTGKSLVRFYEEPWEMCIDAVIICF